MNWRDALMTVVLLAGLAGCSSSGAVSSTVPAATRNPWDVNEQYQQEQQIRRMLSSVDQQPAKLESAALVQR